MTPKYTLLITIFIALVSSSFAQDIKIQLTIFNEKKTVISYTKIVKPHSPFTVRIVRDFYNPTRWNPPKVNDRIFSPVTPEQFEKTNIGITMDCAADSIDGLIRLTGKATVADFQELVQSLYGEHSKPVKDPTGKLLLSENKAQAITTVSTTSNFQVFAKPGKQYKFRIKHLKKWILCRVVCSYVQGV